MPVADTNFSSLLNVSLFNPTTSSTGLNQNSLVRFLDEYVLDFNLALTKLDADAGVTDTDYNSTLAIVDNVNNLPADPIKNNGMFQGAMVTLLGLARTRFNLLLAKLDLDAGVTDTNYNALFNLPAIDVNQISQGGVNQGALYTRINLMRVNINTLLTKLDADA